MLSLRTIKINLKQICAIAEKNVKLKLRFKYALIFSYITPIITILMPLIVMGKFFEFNLNNEFGIWTEESFIVFQMIAYNIYLIIGLIGEFSRQFKLEKFWKTLPAIIIAPFHRYNLLFGIFLSHLLMISIPFSIFFIISIIVFPISIITVISILIIYFLIILVFSGFGLIIGIFAISKENYVNAIFFCFNLIFWASALTYPYQIFPENIQIIIKYNPFYYIFNTLKYTWIENNIFNTINENGSNFIVLIFIALIIPLTAILIFNYIYKKNGIVGY